MKINVGSTNPVKVKAVKTAFLHYFKNLTIKEIDVESGVSIQPTSAEETLKGAKNRAQKAFEKSKCDYGVGIEGGMVHFPTQTGYFLTAIIAIYDGKEFFLGGAPLLELPHKLTEKVTNGEELGPLFDNISGIPNVKQDVGAVGYLSKNIITREHALTHGVVMALCPLLNKELYQ